MTKPFLAVLAAVAVLAAPGCKPKPRDISSIQRKQATTLVGDADFATALRDYAKAEGLLVQATQLCPDNGDYWINLGAIRVKLGKRDDAKAAYKGALAAFEEAAELTPKDPQALLQQIYTLALLGRIDEARALQAKVQKQFPDDRTVRAFAETKRLDAILVSPEYKAMAL